MCIRISLHNSLINYTTNLAHTYVCNKLLTYTHGIIATPASIILTDPSATAHC